MVRGFSSYNMVHGFTDAEIQVFRSYLQGLVYCWCKNKPGQWFAAHDLVGGENSDWGGTPLARVNEYYSEKSRGDHEWAFREAGKTIGRLLLDVLVDDSREFDTRDGGIAREYLWIDRAE